MKTLTILLPDAVSQMLHAEAKRQNIDAVTLCSGLVAEHFLEQEPETPMLSSVEPHKSQTVSTLSSGPFKFDVWKYFPDYPGLSIRLAQQFVDEALTFPGTRAFKPPSGRGVGIEPNFVFVEYLLKRQLPAGIGVSFYGSPSHLNHPGLTVGRNANYSRATAHSEEELKSLLPLIRRSYELRFGRTN